MAEPRKMSESPLLAADYPDRPELALRARDREAAGWPMACVRIRWCPINPWSIKKDDLKALVPEGVASPRRWLQIKCAENSKDENRRLSVGNVSEGDLDQHVSGSRKGRSKLGVME